MTKHQRVVAELKKATGCKCCSCLGRACVQRFYERLVIACNKLSNRNWNRLSLDAQGFVNQQARKWNEKYCD